MKHRQPTRGRHRLAEAGRHRAQEHLLGHGRHRAPLDVAERGRQVAAAAALLASVGVTGAGLARTAPDTGQAVVAVEPPDTAAVAARAAVPAADRAARPGPQLLSAQDKAPRPTKNATKKAPAKKAAPKKVVVRWVDPMPAGRTTSCFGPRWGRLHAGVDLAAPAGTPVRAAGAGRVVEAGTWAGGYGISVLVEHGNDHLTHYAHLRSRLVSVGDRVTVGQQLGEEGSTGNSTGPHLHFEVHRGRWRNPVEPTAWLAERGVTIPGCG